MVNNVVLIGRITRDLELKATTTGREVLNFSIAVNRNFKNAQGQYEADFINCVAFGQTARFMSQYITKGRLISVTGRIQTRTYDNPQGVRQYITEVIADSVNALESRNDGGSNNNYQPQNQGFNQPAQTQSNNGPASFMDNNESPFSVNTISGNDIDDDDLPF